MLDLYIEVRKINLDSLVFLLTLQTLPLKIHLLLKCVENDTLGCLERMKEEKYFLDRQILHDFLIDVNKIIFKKNLKNTCLL